MAARMQTIPQFLEWDQVKSTRWRISKENNAFLADLLFGLVVKGTHICFIRDPWLVPGRFNLYRFKAKLKVSYGQF